MGTPGPSLRLLTTLAVLASTACVSDPTSSDTGLSMDRRPYQGPLHPEPGPSETGLVGDTGSVGDTAPPLDCVLTLQPDEPTGLARWSLEAPGGMVEPLEVTLEASWYQGRVEQHIRYQPGQSTALVDLLPQRMEGHALQDWVEALDGGLFVDLTATALQNDEARCSAHARVPFRAWEGPERLELPGDISLEAGEWDDARFDEFGRWLGLRVSAAQNVSSTDHVVLLQSLLTGDVLSMVRLDHDTVAATATGAISGAGLGGADLFDGQLLVATPAVPGIVHAALFQFELASGALVDSFDTAPSAAEGEALMLHHRFRSTPVDGDDGRRLHGSSWWTVDGGPDAIGGSDSIVAELDIDGLALAGATSWFEPERVSPAVGFYANSISVAPAGADDLRFRTDVFIGMAEELDHSLCLPFMASGSADAAHPELVFIREGCVEEGLLPAYESAYQGVRAVQLPDDPRDGGPVLDMPHDGVVWTREGGTERGLAAYALRMDHDPDATPRISILSFDTAGDAGELARLDCSYDVGVGSESNGNAMMLSADSGIFGAFVGNRRGELHWISDELDPDTGACRLLGRHLLEGETDPEGYSHKELELVEMSQVSDPAVVAERHFHHHISDDDALFFGGGAPSE